MDNLMAYDPAVLITHVLIVAIASMGNVQWLKNWIKPEKKCAYSIVALFVLLLNVTMQMPFVNPVLTWAWNLFTLGNACMQFGHEAILQGIPNLINRAMGAAKLP